MKQANFEKHTIETNNQLLNFNHLYKDLTPSQLWLNEGFPVANDWIRNHGNELSSLGPTGNFFYKN